MEAKFCNLGKVRYIDFLRYECISSLFWLWSIFSCSCFRIWLLSFQQFDADGQDFDFTVEIIEVSLNHQAAL
jgi:hypothetical protein